MVRAARALPVMLALVAALVALVAPRASASVSTDVAAAINSSRGEAGLAPLTPNSSVDAVAQAWAEQLASAGELSHNPSYTDQIPAGWTGAAENVAMASEPSAAGMHTQLMNSPGHRANILGDFTHVGVGFAVDDSGAGWLVEVFARYPGQVSGDYSLGSPATDAAPSSNAPQPAPAAPSPAATVPEGWLGPGSSGEAVRELQQQLADLGYPIDVDGDFGSATSAQVQAFQRDHGLTADGLAGPATLQALRDAVAAATATATAEPTATDTGNEEPLPPTAQPTFPAEVATRVPLSQVDPSQGDPSQVGTAAAGISVEVGDPLLWWFALGGGAIAVGIGGVVAAWRRRRDIST